MNIHPIFVHFPIALLTIYAILEIARFKFLTNKEYYFYIKASFLILGIASASLALQTGEIAEHIVNRSALIERHALFANISTNLFTILAIIYAVTWINKSSWQSKIANSKVTVLWNKITNIINYFNKPIIVISLAVIGLITITITGALGGAIVYGPNIDPIVKFFYNLVM